MNKLEAQKYYDEYMVFLKVFALLSQNESQTQ